MNADASPGILKRVAASTDSDNERMETAIEQTITTEEKNLSPPSVQSLSTTTTLVQCFIIHMTPEQKEEEDHRSNHDSGVKGLDEADLWSTTLALLPDGPAKARIGQHLAGTTPEDRLRGKSALLWRVAGHLSAERLRAGYSSPFLGVPTSLLSREAASRYVSRLNTIPTQLRLPTNPPLWLTQPYHLGRTIEGRSFFIGFPHADVSVSHSGRVSAFATLLSPPSLLASQHKKRLCSDDGNHDEGDDEVCQWRRLGVDIEEVELPEASSSTTTTATSSSPSSGGSAATTTTIVSFPLFMSQRTKRLLPNFSMGELWWLLNAPLDRYTTSSNNNNNSLFDDNSSGSAATKKNSRPFSAIPPHSSISHMLFDECMLRCKQQQQQSSRGPQHEE
ncbi:Hypothetical protein, putative, partial [Bodo saltans]